MHETVLPGVRTAVVGFGGIGGGRQCCGDEGGDGGSFIWEPAARIARVLGGRAVVVTRGVVRGEEIPEELGCLDVGEFYGRHTGRDGLETVGGRVEQVGGGVLDGEKPGGGGVAQLWGGVCVGRMRGGTDEPSNL